MKTHARSRLKRDQPEVFGGKLFTEILSNYPETGRSAVHRIQLSVVGNFCHVNLD